MFVVSALLQPGLAYAQAGVWADTWSSGEEDDPVVYGVASITAGTIGSVWIGGWIQAPNGATLAQSSNSDWAGWVDTYFEAPISAASQQGGYTTGSAGFFDGVHYGCVTITFTLQIGGAINSFYYYKWAENANFGKYLRCNVGICRNMSAGKAAFFGGGSAPDYVYSTLMVLTVGPVRTCWPIYVTEVFGCYAP